MQPEQKMSETRVTCCECGMSLLRITNTHLECCSGMSMAEYTAKHPGQPIESPDLAARRLSSVKGKTYTEIMEAEAATELQARRSATMVKEWAENPEKIQIRELADRPPKIGQPRTPYLHGQEICENCGCEYRKSYTNANSRFCSTGCRVDYSRRESSNYRIKAFAHYPAVCARCGATEKLTVHHVDRNRLNDDVENLEIVCNKCHSLEHVDDIAAGKKEIKSAAVVRGMIEVLHALRVDVRDSNFFNTPRRVARMYEEIFEGLLDSSVTELEEQLSTTFPCAYNEMVVVRDIDCWSMCPHHFLPVSYSISMGYIPNGKVLGLSKLPRLATLLAKRPVMQEQLTQDIIDYFEKYAKPQGVIVKISGKHLCMQMRGVKSKDATMVTAAISGIFKDDTSAKSEFYRLLE